MVCAISLFWGTTWPPANEWNREVCGEKCSKHSRFLSGGLDVSLEPEKCRLGRRRGDGGLGKSALLKASEPKRIQKEMRVKGARLASASMHRWVARAPPCENPMTPTVSESSSAIADATAAIDSGRPWYVAFGAKRVWMVLG